MNSPRSKRPALLTFAALLASACKSKAPESGATITAKTDDVGVVLHASGGPPGTVYTVGKAKLDWNRDSSASAYELGVPTDELPAGGTISVTARWYDDGNEQREQTIAVPFTHPPTAPVQTKLVVKAGLAAPPQLYGGLGGRTQTLPLTPTFVVSFAPLCKVLYDGTEVHTFEKAGAMWMYGSWKNPSDFTIEVKDDTERVRGGRFPDVLQVADKHTFRLECPGLAPQETALAIDPFARASSVREVVAGEGLAARAVGPRKTLVLVDQGSESGSGHTAGASRYYGPPGPVMDVDLVGSMDEVKLTKPACPGHPIDARALDITIRDRAGSRVASTTIEPKVDCAKLEGPNVISVPDSTVLVFRPTDGQVDEWVKSVLR